MKRYKTSEYIMALLVVADMFAGAVLFSVLFEWVGSFLKTIGVLLLSWLSGVSFFIFWAFLRIIKQKRLD
jgi:hypothetical protein